jgi:hypothetical protein
MLSVTIPISTAPGAVWVFVSGDNGVVDVGRIAHQPGTSRFVALPIEVFNPGSVLPTFSPTGELVSGVRWATTADIEAHADLFTD